MLTRTELTVNRADRLAGSFATQAQDKPMATKAGVEGVRPRAPACQLLVSPSH